jgi:adhesin transport system outer membrane protein
MDELVQVSWNQLVNGRKRLRDSGKESAVNVLDSEVEYYSVVVNRINASYDIRLSRFLLLSVMGMLTPDAFGLQDVRLCI